MSSDKRLVKRRKIIVECEEEEEEEEDNEDDDNAVVEVNSEKKIFNTPRDWINELCKNPSIKKPSNRFGCPFCSKPYKLSFDGLLYHLSTSHYNEFFTQKLCKSVSESVIRNHCADILEAEVKKVKPVFTGMENDDDLRKEVPRLVCRFCDNKTYLESYSFKLHFVLNHFNILEENLLALPESNEENAHEWGDYSINLSDNVTVIVRDAFVENIFSQFCEKMPLKKKKTSEVRYRCAICRRKTRQSKPMIEKHLASVHTELFFSEQKLDNVTEKAFVYSCNNYIAQEGFYENDDFVLQCSFCTFDHHEKADLVYHLILEHYEILSENISQFQEQYQIEGYSSKREMEKEKRIIIKSGNDAGGPSTSSIKRKSSKTVKSLAPIGKRIPVKAAIQSRKTASNEKPVGKRIKVRVKYTDIRIDGDSNSDVSNYDSDWNSSNEDFESQSSSDTYSDE